MKVRFNRIRILYYKSIAKAELVYSEGVWLVQGQNNDAFGSNGAGKSTVLEALQQCLYNRTSKGTTLDTTVNRKTGKAYVLTVDFSVDDTNYRIINDRTSLKITIYKEVEGEYRDLMVKSIPAALTYIQTLIGLDFQSFIALTHITHSTVIDMTDNLSNSNLLKVLLDFGVIARFEKKAKEYHKDSQQLTDKLIARKHEIESSVQLMDTFKPIDTTPLYKQLATLNSQASEMREVIDNVTNHFSKLESSITESLTIAKSELDTSKKLLDNRVCPTCGCDVIEYKGIDIDAIERTVSELTEKVQNLNVELQDIHKLRTERLDTEYSKLNEISTTISNLTNRIHVAEYNKNVYDTNKDTMKLMRSELQNINNNLPQEYVKQEVLTHAMQVLKKGVLQAETLKDFTGIVNIFIKEYLSYVSLDYLNITTVPNKGAFSYTVMDLRYNTEITFNELSGGELTRARLIILLAVVKTIQVMTDTSINILIFDEALDTLDKSAASDLARLFNNLVENNDQFIAMVSHGEQLSEIKFRGVITATKTDNVTAITQGA